MATHKVNVRVKAQTPILRANITTAADGPMILTGSDPTEKECEVHTNNNGMLSFAFGIQTDSPDSTWTLTLSEEGATRPRYQHTAVTSSAAIGSDMGNVRFE